MRVVFLQAFDLVDDLGRSISMVARDSMSQDPAVQVRDS